MKHLRPQTVVLSFLLFTLALSGTWCGMGCKSLQQAAYVSARATIESVEVARAVVNDLHRAGKVSDADFERARAAYLKYQASVRVLRDAVLAAKENENEDRVTIAARIVSASAADLISLVNEFVNRK